MQPVDGEPDLRSLIRDRAAESPERPYLEDARSARVLTYRALEDAVTAWSATFDAIGVPASGAVLVDVGDPLAFAVVHLTAVATGRRAVPVDTGQPATEPARLADLIGGASIVVSDRAVDGTGPGVPASGIDAATFLPAAVRDGDVPTQSPDAPGEGSVVLFTSGSTGAPKGVELPESQLLFVARAVARHNGLTGRDRGFNSLPLFHVNAEVVGLLATLVAGATLVLDVRFRRTGFWELLAERRITWLNAVPAILAVLAKTGPLDFPEGLRFVRSASAPLPDPVRTALGDVPLVVSWGMTEGASQITATPLDAPARPGTVGVPVGSEVQARGEDGAALPADEVGALWVRGPGIVGRYLFGRAADRFDADGWLSTGDVGSVAADGWVSLAGRSDDVINRGGEKVYPSEVEDVLLGDPRVLEAVVVGRPDDVLGAVPVAYVILQQGEADEADEADAAVLVADLTARAEAHLTRFRRPVEIIVVPDLPRAPTGKVQRAKVRTMAQPS
ncbi:MULTISPECIES: class I adenylate-forming enzyme family protein [unclassified Curtobacterium]|uniref:class I adenylate-forming enzyme family protein n=1 Tax=unclassified Curtobacterium TaxID=257496 RepID=UPI000F485D7C|nr:MULTISPECIES: AMP-binding protein [unclassified Curtobacterium]ROQ07559.1 acyl-CoA synthetase (AMP-forming)/AMP-acid ligase II [Curtobacterium sp. PhB171]ROQ23830.1 acyl-CoA synthetase (AMP-forming)/AMP-acid ligase II [Curtobacterium sp. PhB170]ROS35744.1 acyl-CoA synthetase (AMP-forming)/AMP-acid ligase II [Curtobacterium sp. PhB131]ROS69853.1 acyl-CoA synthetase (AMP-forming)/AMP-acid ligase II [Curtobacterium sp. PhB141]